jgi:hypothetical protein
MGPGEKGQQKGAGIFIPAPFSIHIERALFVGCFRTTGTTTATVCSRASRGLVAITLVVPAVAFKGESGLGDQFRYPPAALLTFSQRHIGKLLAGLENQATILTLIFVHRHRDYLTSSLSDYQG